MRGALLGGAKRFIPTGVGNATGVDLKDVMNAVHPHGCGERSKCTLLISLEKTKHQQSTSIFHVVKELLFPFNRKE